MVGGWSAAILTRIIHQTSAATRPDESLRVACQPLPRPGRELESHPSVPRSESTRPEAAETGNGGGVSLASRRDVIRWVVPLAVGAAVWLMPHGDFDGRTWGLLCVFAGTIAGLIAQPLPCGGGGSRRDHHSQPAGDPLHPPDACPGSPTRRSGSSSQRSSLPGASSRRAWESASRT